MKITFIGDIMCEPSVLKGARQKDGSYDFRPMFEKVKPLLAEADYVVILDSGKIAAQGTPLELKNAYTADHVTLYGVDE